MSVNTLVSQLKLHGTFEDGFMKTVVDRDVFTKLCTRLSQEFGRRLALFYATDDCSASHTFGIHAVFDIPESHEWFMISTKLPETDATYESLTKTIMAAHWYERYAMDQFGLTAIGHPDPRRLVHHENVPLGTYPLRKSFVWNTKMDHADVPYPLHRVEGMGVYEIPVGPIHAGIIEPGHFRFHVAGERIITLEAKLFFTHKGVEKLLEGKTITEALPFVERISGDMAVSNALAFSQAIETLCQVTVSERARIIRTVLAECERLTMHIHDLANICGMGTGFTVMAAQGFRIKERLMRLSEEVCGNRFWRGLIVPGGLSRDLSDETLAHLQNVITDVVTEMQALVLMGRRQDGLRERLETSGILTNEAATAYGAVGLGARSSGVDLDVRRDHPYAEYEKAHPEVVVLKTGDVYARFKMRYLELDESARLISQLLISPPDEPIFTKVVVKDGIGMSAVESWRGEILTTVHLKHGKIERCFPRDPSFCNWALFGELAPGNIVPDFPLCNKSLNLSYSGNDL